MNSIRHLAVACAVTVGLAAGQLSAQPQPDRKHSQHWTKGQDVTLSACVARGEKDDTFVLTHVADVPVHPATMGRVVYWLDTVKDVKQHVGGEVHIVGKIDDVKQGEMELRSGEDERGGWYVEIEGPGRDVRTSAAKAGVSAADRKNASGEIKTTLVRLKVDDVKRVADRCPQS
jgi:hypothetical protein